MRDYITHYCRDGKVVRRVAISDLPTDEIHRALRGDFQAAGFNGASREAIIERLKIELLIRELSL